MPALSEDSPQDHAAAPDRAGPDSSAPDHSQARDASNPGPPISASSISGKSTVDWAAFAAALAPVETIADTARVKKRSRDFFWYSPILDRELSRSFGDLVALPATQAELARVVALTAERRVPVTLRGGGTGNYGQAVPVEGGLVLDMTRLDAIPEIGPDFVRAEAGARIGAINKALAAHGRELPIYPSTEAIATIGGFIAGGSGGIGSVREGMLRDRGNIAALAVLSMESPPRREIFEGEAANAVHHAWGINGVIAEVTLRTVPRRDWVDVIAAFGSYPEAFRAAAGLGAAQGIDLKLLTTVDRRIIAAIRHLDGHVPADRDLLLAMVAPEHVEAVRAAVEASGGRLAFRRDEAPEAALPPLAEFSYNHTTLQVLKTDRGVTYLQITMPDPVAEAPVAALAGAFGDEVLMHHEFALLDGRLVAFDLPIVRFTTAERLYAIMDVYRAHGCRVSDPHRWTVETGGMKPDYRHLAWKKRLDPHDLMNSAKSRAWPSVRHLAAEEIEKL